MTIQAVPALREAVGWPLAFGILAVGPAAGMLAMRKLDSLEIARRSSPSGAGPLQIT